MERNDNVTNTAAATAAGTGLSRTSVSAGEIVRDLLMTDEQVKRRARKVYPLVADESILPYIVYRRSGMQTRVTKAGSSSDSIEIELHCYTEGYQEGVELAEAVRGALDHTRAELDGLVMRSCHLVDGEELTDVGCYVQKLVFSVQIY